MIRFSEKAETILNRRDWSEIRPALWSVSKADLSGDSGWYSDVRAEIRHLENIGLVEWSDSRKIYCLTTLGKELAQLFS